MMAQQRKSVSWPLLLLLVLSLQCVSRGADAYSFLLAPLPGGISHCLEMMGIGRVLQERGHTVHLLMPDFAEVNKCVPEDLRAKINVITFETDPEVTTFIQSYVKKALETMASGDGGSVHMFRTLNTVIPRICKTYTATRPILDQFIATKEGPGRKPDMVLVDGIFFGRCLSLLPAYLDTRLALTGSFISPYDSNMPWPVISYPIPLADLPGQMTFGQRIVNTLGYGFVQMMMLIMDLMSEHGDDFGEGLANFDFGAGMRRADLYLENSDYILDYAKATYPNFVQVGGLTTGPAKPLPDELHQYFDSSKDGVVVISLGSMMYNTSQAMADKLLTAAAKVGMSVVLRINVAHATVPVPDNVKVVSWFPQNDALGHPHTRLLVSHCGKNSFFEGLYHGVPILCTPLNGDAFGTSGRVTHFGVGGSIDLKAVTAEELGGTINRIIEDPKIRQKMKFYSTLFHERPETPGHRAASALEHVIQYGGDHLRPQTVELSFVQYTGLDVFCVLLLAVLGLVGVGVCSCGHILRKLCRRLSRSPAEQKGKNKGTKRE